MLARQHSLKALLDQLLSRSRDGRKAGVKSLGNLAVAPSFTAARGVGLQQDARLHQPLGGVLAAADHRVKAVALLRIELHDVFLYGNLFRSHESPPAVHCRTIDSKKLLTVNDVRH